MPNIERIRLKLETEVDYVLNGASIDELTHRLGKVPFEAFREGALTGEGPAECSVMSCKVERTDPDAPALRAITAADYLRKAIWGLDDLIRLYPDGPFLAVRQGLSDRLMEEMSKGPKEVK